MYQLEECFWGDWSQFFVCVVDNVGLVFVDLYLVGLDVLFLGIDGDVVDDFFYVVKLVGQIVCWGGNVVWFVVYDGFWLFVVDVVGVCVVWVYVWLNVLFLVFVMFFFCDCVLCCVVI